MYEIINVNRAAQFIGVGVVTSCRTYIVGGCVYMHILRCLKLGTYV